MKMRQYYVVQRLSDYEVEMLFGPASYADAEDFLEGYRVHYGYSPTQHFIVSRLVDVEY